VLLGFKAQHRVTGKFYTVWAEDDADARVRIAGYLKVPVNEILRALPSQAMGPDAIRFDPKSVPPPGAPSTPEKSTTETQLPWQFPTLPATAALSGPGKQQEALPAPRRSYTSAAERSYSADYGSIARPVYKVPFEDRNVRQSETSTVVSESEENDSPSSSSLKDFIKVA